MPPQSIASPAPVSPVEAGPGQGLTEDERLASLYEGLRERLLDLTNRNPMLATRIAPNRRSRRLLQVVHVALETVYQALKGDDRQALDILPLAEPDGVPADERSEAFTAAFEHARLVDADYLAAIERLDADGRDDDAALMLAEEALRLKLRAELGLPARPERHEIDRAAHALGLGIDPDPNLQLRQAMTEGARPNLQTLRFADDLAELLDRVSDAARLTVQETGLSSLYLAFGFLERPDRDVAGKTHRAPLLLLPVRLQTRKTDGREIVTVSAAGSLEANLSLRRLIERDYRRRLPDLVAEAAEQGDFEALGPIGGYFDGVGRAIDGLKGFQIRPWLVLGAFSVGRHQIYHDLHAENWPQPPVTHPLVRAILAGSDQPGRPSDFAAAADFDVDTAEIEGIVPNLVADADASQHQALVDVARQHNLVIEGPPGTGKSQTITNIIAHAIGAGKKVLFVAEKQAALDVVRRRLAGAGLGSFCLDLHSDSAVPKTVIEALKARADLGWGKPASPSRSLDPALKEARQSIRSYLDALHDLLPDGETPYRLMWRSIRAARGKEPIYDALQHLSPAGNWLQDPAELQALHDVVEIYALAAGEFEARHGPVGASPWSRTGLKDVPAYDLMRIRAALIEWREPLLEAAMLQHASADLGVRTLGELARLATAEAGLGAVGGARLLVDLHDVDIDAAERVIDLQIEIADLESFMAATPDLVLSPRAATARAAELVASRFGRALADRVPLDLNRAIRARVVEAEDLIAAIEGLMPAFDALGLDRALPADTAVDVALLSRALRSMPASRRAELFTYRAIATAPFLEAEARYRDLMEAAEDWRQHFPGLDVARLPSVGDLRRAASWLRLGSLQRSLTGMSAEARSVRALLRGLTAGTQATPDPALLDQLADFSAYCEAFRDDRGFQRSFGAIWRGLATPFAEIRASIDLRRAFAQMLGQALRPLVATTEARLDLLDLLGGASDAAVQVVVGQAEAAERFLSLPAESRARLQAFTLGSAIPHLEAEIRAAAALDELAGDPMLMSLERPLQVIADYHAARERLAGLRRDMAALPAASKIGHLIASGDPREAAAAIAWLRAVNAADVADEAKAVLTSSRAGEARALLQRIAADARPVLDRLRAIAAETEAAFGWFNLDDGEPAALLGAIDALIQHHGQLADFLALKRLKLDLATDGLGLFLDAAERLQVPMTDLPHVFQTLVARSRADQARRQSGRAQVTGMELDIRRKIFADRDRQRIATDRAAIRARLIELASLKPIPGHNLGPKSTWTELALLKSEFAKTSRYLPIRTLLARAGRSIQALMPCVMASPMSLAKFAPPGKLTFDLIVIDEASQMRPEDALGGLLRATQAVVVGDPKQLPPTDFFRRAAADRPQDADDDEIDAESILDICARSFSRVRRLTWHYRSRCESLIGFSNREFYRDSLITFPNSRPDAFSIDLVRVNGLYRNRRNPDEAARIAEEAVRFMRHFGEADDCPTLGIATLNMEQRDLIREELRRISVGDELVAAYMARVEAGGEPVFVKNLENLQGDERDVILISLVRGPASGSQAIAQTFGPIGGRHGARRLNVLFTRARRRIAIFASLGSQDIRTGDTSPYGVRVLKRYLQYVEERGRAPALFEGREPDGDFEQEVADRLMAAGFDVALQVGVSHYRIDLGVRHPDRPGTFLAGIECDGASYHSSKSARERDRLRDEVLEGLGWKLIRVWSTDWFADPQEETRRLVRRLDLLRVLPARSGEDYVFGFAGEGASAAFPPSVERTRDDADESVEQLKLDLDNPNEASDNATETVRAIGAADGSADDPLSVFGHLEEAQAAYLAVPEDGAGPAMADGLGWSLDRLREALVAFRDQEISPTLPDAPRGRSILRPGLIETFVNEHIVDASQWTEKVPLYQRLGTNSAELVFLERICALVAKLG